jgi:hypothetical protein
LDWSEGDVVPVMKSRVEVIEQSDRGGIEGKPY